MSHDQYLLQLAQTDISDGHLLYFIEHIRIAVTASISVEHSSHYLVLNFNIQLPKTDDGLANSVIWSKWCKTNVDFVDYLWESSCLECFLGKRDTNEYVEINASPDGRYAVYHFDNYRTPNGMPPKRLLCNNPEVMGKIVEPDKQAKIDWIRDNLNNDHNDTERVYQRCYRFEMTQLPKRIQHFDQIHPCVILYLNHDQKSTLPLFFATKHTQPADFHNRRYWSPFPPNFSRKSPIVN